MSINQHIDGIVQSIRQRNGTILAQFLHNSFNNGQQIWSSHNYNNLDQLQQLLQTQCRSIPSNLQQVIVSHLLASYTHIQHNIELTQKYCYESAEYLFTYIEQEKDIIWCLPAINVICIQL